MDKIAIGCDIGGSHISCAAVISENGQIIKESYVTQDLNNQGPAEEIFNNWTNAITRVFQKIDKSSVLGIGFAMPGPFEYHTGIARFTGANEKYQNLNGIDIGKVLKDRLQLNDQQDVRFINDATAFAMGEAWAGKASRANRSLSVTLGTGFGSAFIDEGAPVVERDDVPKLGCVWHLPFKEKIADDYFSTRWFIKRFTEKTGVSMIGVKEIANRALSDPRALEVFTEFGENLAVFLVPWLNKFKADTLVIGGSISGAYPLFGQIFEESLQKQGINVSCNVSELKEDAAIIGSARLFNTKIWEQVFLLLSKM